MWRNGGWRLPTLGSFRRCYRNGALMLLDPPGPRLPLGIYPDMAYSAVEVALQAGDLVVCVTDGVVEAKNATGELWGFERLEALLLTQGAATPEQVVDAVFEAACAFMGGQAQHDDMTVVVLRVE
jgi:phosphoserine phosphatase RsbU/P